MTSPQAVTASRTATADLATGRPYAMDNHHQASKEHHQALADLLDAHSRARVSGLRTLAGARCLEVGAGGGSISVWMADQVGTTGQVVATDLKPDHLPSHPRLSAIAHQHTSDDPWPAALIDSFDLIFARLVLSHLPQRDVLLLELTRHLAPGGVLLIEDWAVQRHDMLISAPTQQAAELYRAYQQAVRAVFDTSGTHRDWARETLHPALVQAGMVEVDTVIHGSYWTGGSPGCRLVSAVARQLRPKLLAAGLTDEQFTQLIDLLADPRLVVHGHPLYSTSARREG